MNLIRLTSELSLSNRVGQIGYDDYGNEVDDEGILGLENHQRFLSMLMINMKLEM